jgi:vitamin-K-epoxide reductase (warfarin-sensitive)
VTESSRRLMSLIAILAVCGIVVSSISLQHHFATSKTAYCDLGAMLNCDIVNRSEYSSILGVPVAFIGMLGYAALVGLATVYRNRPQTRALLFVGSAAGLAFACYLTYVEARVLGVYCILCLTSLALISLITLASGLLWWRREDP